MGYFNRRSAGKAPATPCYRAGEESGLDYFQTRLLVSPEKSKLCLTTMHNEEKLLVLSKPESFSLYISIPFCPTRCSYCSFVSSSVEKP